MSIVEDTESWEQMKLLAVTSDCWWCGNKRKPAGWHAHWIIERAHIVNNPRREDRRAANLLCSACHKTQHGGRFSIRDGTGSAIIMFAPSLAEMLWMKLHFDGEFYDRKFLQANSVCRLPKARKPVVIGAVVGECHIRWSAEETDFRDSVLKKAEHHLLFQSIRIPRS